jgi:hypothetical protein
MARIKRYNGDDEKITSVWNDAGDKRYGFAAKDRMSDGRTRYGIGADFFPQGLGSSDHEINTPLGTLDYGVDDETRYAGFTPNVVTRPGLAALMSSNGDRLGFLQKLAGGGLGVGIDNMGSPYRGAYDGEINTPLGSLGYGYDGDTVYGNVRPNAQYINAIVNLLRGQR